MVVARGVLHEHMPLYMNACDLLLLTSMHEGSPNVVKEALACNLPVLSTAVGDVPQRIKGIGGCAIVPAEPGAIAAALQTTLQRHERVASRQTIQPLDERSLTEQVIAVYQQAIGTSSRPR